MIGANLHLVLGPGNQSRIGVAHCHRVGSAIPPPVNSIRFQGCLLPISSAHFQSFIVLAADRIIGLLLTTGVILGAFLTGPARLEAQIDPSGSWVTWKSEHFRVNIHTDLSHLAQQVIDEAERAYALLATELVPPRGTIDLSVFDNVDFSNGAATVFPSNRLLVFLPQPATDAALSYYDDWLRLVLVHELTHLFHLDRTRGVWRGLQYVFGRAPWLFPNAYRSSWVKEGVATYYESRFSTAGRVRGAFHTQLLTTTTAAGRWPTAEDATLVAPNWPGGQRPYAWGGRFFERQTQMFGDSVVPNFFERSAAKLWPLTVASPLQEAGGASVDEGWASLEQAMSLPERQSQATILVRGLRAPPNPAMSPDGSRYAYVRQDGKRDVAVVVRSIDGHVYRSHRVNGGVRLNWGDDDMVIAQYQYLNAVTIRSQLYRWGESGWHLIPNTERLTEPFRLADGGVGAIEVGRGHRRPVIATASSDDRALPVPVDAEWTQLATRGDWFAGVALVGGRRSLYLWQDEFHSVPTRVSFGEALIADPVWSLDGSAVLFVSEATGFPQVYRYDLHGESVSQVTDEPFGAREPQPLPDGGMLFTTTLFDGMAVGRLTADQLIDVASPISSPPTVTPAPAAPSQEGVGYNPWPALVPRYWSPLLHIAHQSGTFVGAFTSANDAIGRNSYFASLSVAPGPGRLEGLLFAAHQRWKGASVDIVAQQSWAGLNLQASDGSIVPVGEREREASFGTTLRKRWWRTGYAIRFAGGLEQASYFDETAGGVQFFDSPTFATATLSATMFRRERPALSISPENGFQLDGLYRLRQSLRDDDWSYEVRGALAGYLAMGLPGFAHWVVAARSSIGVTGGAAPATLSIGGESGDVFELAPGVSLGAGRRAFGMRGYPRISGYDRAWVNVFELRVPLANVAKGTWYVPIVLDRVSTTAFYEIGVGRFLGDQQRQDWLQSAGAELVFDLGVLYDVPTRLRVGVAVPLTDGNSVSHGDTRSYLSFGASF